MHISVKEVSAYIERQAQKQKDYASKDPQGQYADRLGVAEVIIWDLIMDLELDKRITTIKRMKK
jgi:hypothetical protein